MFCICLCTIFSPFFFLFVVNESHEGQSVLDSGMSQQGLQKQKEEQEERPISPKVVTMRLWLAASLPGCDAQSVRLSVTLAKIFHLFLPLHSTHEMELMTE